MIDAYQSQAGNRVPFRGWLLVYAIGPVGFGNIAALARVVELWRYGGDSLEWLISVVLLLIYAVGMYLPLAYRKRITRFYHISLTGFMAAALALIAVSGSDPAAALASSGMCVWAAYWTRSKRVRQTYCGPDYQQR